MTTLLDRRTFTKALALGLAGTAVPVLNAQKARRLKVGHTGITWGFSPADAEKAIADAASLGFHGYESFGNVLESWEARGGLDKVLDAAKLPLRSAYCPVNLTDPTKRKAEVETIVRWGQLIKKCGGRVAVIGPNNVKRPEYTFADHRSNIVEALNEIGKALTDIGIVGALHQHTDTCIETRDETYAVMEAVDTRYVKFGPDVGQLQKGGSDPVKVVKDLLPTVRHVHMKDFDGGPHYQGYCPLGQGKVDIAALCDLLEGSGNDLMIMCELDPSKAMPVPPLEAARINKQTMEKLGYAFRA
jgi:inosose dehydratase